MVSSLCFSPGVSQAWLRIGSSTDHKKGEIIVKERVDNFEAHSTELQCRGFLLWEVFCHEQGTAIEGRTSWSEQDLTGWKPEKRQITCGVDWGRFLSVEALHDTLWGAHLQYFFWKWKDFLSEKGFCLAVKGLIWNAILFFSYLKISGTCRIFSWTGNTSKRPVTNSDWELEKHLLDKNRSEQPPTWTNVANNRVGMDHGTFMSVLTGREGFLNKQKYSSVD